MNLRKMSIGLVAGIAVVAFSAAPAMADWFVGGSVGYSSRPHVRSYVHRGGYYYRPVYYPVYRSVYRPVVVAPVYQPVVVAPVYAPRPVVYYSPPVRSGFSFSFGVGHGHRGYYHRPAYSPRHHYSRHFGHRR